MTYINFIWLLTAPFLLGLLAMAVQKRYDQSIKLFLSFSGAFLLVTCINHLLPELFSDGETNLAPYILMGFFLQILFEFISQGVEHGHIHRPDNASAFPGLVYLGLCIHAFTEGLPLAGLHEGMTSPALFWGILMHKLPIAVILISLLSAHEVSKGKQIAALAFFACLAPAGGIFGNAMGEWTEWDIVPYFLAGSIGIFLHISTVILFETSKDHRFNLMKFAFVLIGGLLAFFMF